MKYDFTSIIDRHHRDSIAVDGVGAMPNWPQAPTKDFDIIPMWIADMNFPCVPTVMEEIIKRANHPTFGYFFASEEYHNSIIRWQKNRNNVDVETKNIGYENGVLGGVVSALNVFCSKGDNVLVHSPTYIGFTNTLNNNGYHIVSSELYKDENDIWRMDYDDMEKKIIENHIHATIFCSPHNPTGRVWEKEELEKAMAIFEKHNVKIISDEIWSDIILKGNKHIPTSSISSYAKDNVVSLYAPSKTFNLAGLVGAYHIIYNDYIHDRILKESSLSHYNQMNVLSMHGLIGAYKDEGYEWLGELIEVLSANVDYGYNFIKDNFEGVNVSKPQGTYMLFLCCKEYCGKYGITIDTILQRGWDVGVAWQDGRPFHGECGIRINLALPKSRVIEAFDRIKKYVFIEAL